MTSCTPGKLLFIFILCLIHSAYVFSELLCTRPCVKHRVGALVTKETRFLLELKTNKK